MYAMYASASAAGYAMILVRHVAKRCKGKAQLSCDFMIKQKQHDDEEYHQVMYERWTLHGNVSRNGYGNAMIGRYGGYFEEDIMRLMYDRGYHAKDLDAPAKFAPTPTRRAMHGTEEASNI